MQSHSLASLTEQFVGEHTVILTAVLGIHNQDYSVMHQGEAENVILMLHEVDAH